jgi:hypothetical protein
MIVAGEATLFRHSPSPGANDEKVGLLGSLPRVASASRSYPGLLSVALSEGVLIIGASDYLEGISAEKMVFQKYG